MKTVPVCGLCGRGVDTVVGPRHLVEPISRHWPAALRCLASPTAVLWLGLFTAAVQLLLSVRLFPELWLLGRLLMLGWMFYVARRGGRGLDPFGRPTYGDLVSVWRGPLVRVLPMLAPVTMMCAWWVALGQRAVPPTYPWDLALGAVLVPTLGPALAAVSIEGDGRRWALPGPVWRAFRQTPGGWGPRLGLMGAMVGLELWSARLEPLNMEDTSMFSAILVRTAVHLGVVVAATAFGLLTGQWLVTWAPTLGHESGEATVLPWVRELPWEEWTPPKPDENVVAAERARRFAPIELADPRQAFEAAVADGRAAEAMLLLQRREVVVDAVSGELLIELAQRLVGQGELGPAAELLEGVVRRGQDAAVPRALVILARLLEERLHKEDRAQLLFQQVVDRFPETSAATFARSRLR